MKNNFIHKISPEKSLRYVEYIFKLEGSKKMTVLDLGSSNAMFAKLYNNNIKVYHAFDLNKKAVLSGRKFLKKKYDFDWYIESFNLKMYDKFIKKYKNILLKTYDIVIFNRVFHYLYPWRLYRKWRNGRYHHFDLLFNSLNLSSKWYVFSTTIKHVNMFKIKDFFSSTDFNIVFEIKSNTIDKNSYYDWSFILKKNK